MGQIIAGVVATVSIITGSLFGINISSADKTSDVKPNVSSQVTVEPIVLTAGGSAGLQP